MYSNFVCIMCFVYDVYDAPITDCSPQSLHAGPQPTVVTALVKTGENQKKQPHIVKIHQPKDGSAEVKTEDVDLQRKKKTQTKHNHRSRKNKDSWHTSGVMVDHGNWVLEAMSKETHVEYDPENGSSRWKN